jgi:selenocysteine lyase/cysteine desulfurase
VLETGWTNIQRRGTFIGCGTDLLPDARRFEAGSLNTNGVYGLRAALDLIHEIGIDVIAERAIGVASLLAARLEEIGMKVASPLPVRSGIVAATPPTVEKSLLWWHRQLEEKGVVCAPREGFLRFSPHFYNDAGDVERVISSLSAIINS